MSDKNRQSLIFFIVLCTFCVTIFYSFAEGWYSAFVIWLFGYFVSVLYLRKAFAEEKKNVTLLFTLSYSVYSLYMYVTNYLFVEDPALEFFMMVDSFKFWNYSNYELRNLSDVWARFQDVLPYTQRYPLFSLNNLLLSFFAQTIDVNNILVLKLQSVWIGAFSMPFIYLCLLKFLERGKAFKYTLFFSLFSFVVIYSVVLNRDPHVYLIYTIGTYLLIHYDTGENILFKLIVLMILACGFRLEHGLFFVIFILAFFYLKSQKNKQLLMVLLVVVPVGMLLLAPTLMGAFEENEENYQNQIERVDRGGEASAGASFSGLPVGLKQLAMGINSQIAPAVPFWRGWYPDPNDRTYKRFPVPGYFTPWRFMESIAALVWIYMWGIMIYGYFAKKFKGIPIELKVSFGIAILLILAASSSINVRRIYCVYPAVFCMAMFIYNRLSRQQQIRANLYSTMVLLLLYGMYGIFKGF